MLPEFGHLSLILAFVLACATGVLPMVGAWRKNAALMNLSGSLASGVFVFTALAFALLAQAFLTDDFSVRIVAANSNSLLPEAFKFAAVWGNHEGSLLLWALILSGWMLAVVAFSRGLPLPVVARVLAVMGLIAAGFLAFSLFTSSPFERLLPGTPLEGSDLNPLLQDPGLVIHPPILYMGYVGLVVPFAFAIAALLGGQLDVSWARWSRPWTNVAWAFLSLGIMLGSWWAYYELGWGGWWFWDPVENASFMPWLVATALIHSLAVTEKRGVFRAWTVLLAIAAFSLSLLGTFLVRSGVLTSVHAFAADPERGVFILIFLALVVGGSLLLFALRAPQVASSIDHQPLSRETLLLINNVIFAVSALTVLLGTLFPLIMDAVGAGKYSVGPPYFNAVFVPLMALLVPFMVLGPATRWKRDAGRRIWQEVRIPAAVAVTICVMAAYLSRGNLWVALAALLSGWLLLGLFWDVHLRSKGRSSLSRGLAQLSPSYWGMCLAHVGFALAILGATVLTQFGDERDVRMEVGETATLGDYSFRFATLEQAKGSNYDGDRGVFVVSDSAGLVTTLNAEKRRYFASNQIMTEAGIDGGLLRDLFVALGEPLEGDAWSVRLQHKPLIRWIWAGAIFMALGGLVTVADRRYRSRKARVASASGQDAMRVAT